MTEKTRQVGEEKVSHCLHPDVGEVQPATLTFCSFTAPSTDVHCINYRPRETQCVVLDVETSAKCTQHLKVSETWIHSKYQSFVLHS